MYAILVGNLIPLEYGITKQNLMYVFMLMELQDSAL